jgi:hypothetical protein
MAITLKRQRKKSQKIWLAQPKDVTLFTKLRKVIKFYKNICKHKAVDFWGKKKAKLKHKLEKE